MLACFGLVAGLGWWVAAGPAAADVIRPPGACSASGTWTEAGFTETSDDHDPSDVIEVPQADTVSWAGGVGDGSIQEGPEREISGEVQLDLPIGTITLDDWSGDSIRYANADDYEYDLPALVIGIELTLHGAHREDGAKVCSGSVGMVVEGEPFDNPLAFAGLGGIVVFGAGAVLAGRGKPPLPTATSGPGVTA